MTYYWRAKNIPELQEVAVVDRREWLHVARERTTRQLINAIAVMIIVLTSCVAGDIARWQLSNWYAQSKPILWFAQSSVTIGVMLFAYFLLDALRLQPRARQWLREHLHEFRTNNKGASA